MALTIGAGGGGGAAAAASTLPIGTGRNHHFLRPPILFPSSNPPPSTFWSLHQFTAARNGNNTFVVKAAKKLSSSRTGKFDSKNKRSLASPTKEEQIQRSVQIETDDSTIIGGGVAADAYDGYFLPDLPGGKPDFWEGPQWDTLGFFVQYLWAFGILFAIIACGIAVATYNEGATDFKATPAYKESIQSRQLLEEPEGSNSDVFESNPTEEAPSLE